MKLQVLHINDCPNTAEATMRLKHALDAVELHDLTIDAVLIRTEADAANSPFAGSPTFLLDGADLFPATPTRSLACRVYPTENGFAGTPTQAQLEQALREGVGSLHDRVRMLKSIETGLTDQGAVV